MNIFLDESGSFVSAEERDSWNVIVAYMSPESDRGKLQAVLTRLKRATGVSRTNEIKLRNVQEKDYFDFLFYLGKLNGVLSPPRPILVYTVMPISSYIKKVKLQKSPSIKM